MDGYVYMASYVRPLLFPLPASLLCLFLFLVPLSYLLAFSCFTLASEFIAFLAVSVPSREASRCEVPR